MEQLMNLWLPILVATIAVWMASAVFWMVLPHHVKDMRKLSDEDGLIDALKGLGVGPGSYSFPFCADKASWKDEELMRKWTEGPSGFMTIMRPQSMARNMVCTIVVNLFVSIFVAYLTSQARVPGADFASVFQVAATAGVMAYLFGWMGSAIWFQLSKNAWISNAIDSVAYGLIMGLVFALLWPGAPVVG